jgi:hypothetical protein
MAVLDTIIKFRPVMDQPVGKAAAYAAGFGVTRTLSGIIAHFLKLKDSRGYAVPEYGSVLLAVLAKLDAVRGMIGDDIAELLATAGWIDAILGLTNIDRKIAEGVTDMLKLPKAMEAAATVLSKGAPALTAEVHGYEGFPAGYAQVAIPEIEEAPAAGLTPFERKLAAMGVA